MVFHVDRESLVGRVEARAFRHCPALENPVKLKAQVVMKMACGVFLDYIEIARRTCIDLARRLGGAFEAAFLKICLKSHVLKFPGWISIIFT
jgi:hypothetical protein